jgi:hypothetical protein
MSEVIGVAAPLHDPAGTIPESAQELAGQVTIYDPAMCCPTGLCGPGVDPTLLAISRDLRWLEKQGVVVERFGLSQEPGAFVQQPRIAGLMQAFGDTALPATLVNGAVLVHGRYPSREEIVAALGADAGPQAPLPAAVNNGCGCAPGSSCS